MWGTRPGPIGCPLAYLRHPPPFWARAMNFRLEAACSAPGNGSGYRGDNGTSEPPPPHIDHGMCGSSPRFILLAPPTGAVNWSAALQILTSGRGGCEGKGEAGHRKVLTHLNLGLQLIAEPLKRHVPPPPHFHILLQNSLQENSQFDMDRRIAAGFSGMHYLTQGWGNCGGSFSPRWAPGCVLSTPASPISHGTCLLYGGKLQLHSSSSHRCGW